MTETDTPTIRTRSQYQTRAPESLPRATEERKWIHHYFRSPVTDKAAHKQTRIERQDGLMFATGHSKE